MSAAWCRGPSRAQHVLQASPAGVGVEGEFSAAFFVPRRVWGEGFGIAFIFKKLFTLYRNVTH